MRTPTLRRAGRTQIEFLGPATWAMACVTVLIAAMPPLRAVARSCRSVVRMRDLSGGRQASGQDASTAVHHDDLSPRGLRPFGDPPVEPPEVERGEHDAAHRPRGVDERIRHAEDLRMGHAPDLVVAHGEVAVSDRALEVRAIGNADQPRVRDREAENSSPSRWATPNALWRPVTGLISWAILAWHFGESLPRASGSRDNPMSGRRASSNALARSEVTFDSCRRVSGSPPRGSWRGRRTRGRRTRGSGAAPARV